MSESSPLFSPSPEIMKKVVIAVFHAGKKRARLLYKPSPHTETLIFIVLGNGSYDLPVSDRITMESIVTLLEVFTGHKFLVESDADGSTKWAREDFRV